MHDDIENRSIIKPQDEVINDELSFAHKMSLQTLPFQIWNQYLKRILWTLSSVKSV